jgi:thiol-disulfide isomerase/thioredoxin
MVSACWFAVESTASADKVAWRPNFRTAVGEAGRLQKPLLVEISASWCGYCHKMHDETFTDKRIIKQVNGCFVPVTLDADNDERIVEAIGVEGLPTTVIISPDLKVIKKITGFQSAAQLNRQLRRHCLAKKSKERLTRPAHNATPAKPVSSVANYAFGQYCLVSMLQQGKLVPGRPEFTSRHSGRLLAFASAEQKQAFDANPEKYWPDLDGLCPVTLRDRQQNRPGDPRMAVIYRGRIFMTADQEAQSRFLDSADQYLR